MRVRCASMTDRELRELCHRFFDAIERSDVTTLAQIYAPDFRLWANVSGAEIGAEENLRILRDGAALHRRRTYDDRTINTFERGFLVQYSVNVVTHAGNRSSLWACLVAQCKDGKIARIDEYLDAGKFGRPRSQGDSQ
jgi:ketosteroid isomerase-like protein